LIANHNPTNNWKRKFALGADKTWEDMKFDIKHWKDIEKLAIIGESKWEAGMAAFCKPFTSAKIKYFEQSNLEGAREWIVAD